MNSRQKIAVTIGAIICTTLLALLSFVWLERNPWVYRPGGIVSCVVDSVDIEIKLARPIQREGRIPYYEMAGKFSVSKAHLLSSKLDLYHRGTPLNAYVGTMIGRDRRAYTLTNDAVLIWTSNEPIEPEALSCGPASEF